MCTSSVPSGNGALLGGKAMHPETTITADGAPVLVSRSDGVVTVTLNQPRRKNAIPAQGWAGLRDAFSSVRLRIPSPSGRKGATPRAARL